MSILAHILSGVLAYPESPGYKEKGGTSEQAAREIEQDAKAIRERIVAALLTLGDMTSPEIAIAINEDLHNVAPRVSELQKPQHGCRVFKTKERRRNERNKPVIVWSAKKPQEENA